MHWEVFQLILWLMAGLVSFSFSLGNARVWTSIAVGFFLILVGELIPYALPLLSGAQVQRVEAMGYIVGTLSILVMSHGFLEYYVFSRTLELEGNKMQVFLATLGGLLVSFVFLSLNPPPDARSMGVIRIVENTTWVFLSLINIDLIRRIYLNIRDSPMSKAFLTFIAVFFFTFLWKGSQLYIQVYHLEKLGNVYPFRYHFSLLVSNVGNVFGSLTVGGTFLYLARLLR